MNYKRKQKRQTTMRELLDKWGKGGSAKNKKYIFIMRPKYKQASVEQG